jgi:hypothetical protein
MVQGRHPVGGAGGRRHHGLSGLAVLDASLPRGAALPRGLVHRLTIAFEPNSVPPGFPTPVPYRTGPSPVLRGQPVTIAPPLRGAGWVAVNGCCDALNGHRGGIIPIDGHLRAVERFAIDFVQLRSDRRLFAGPLEDLSSYRYSRPRRTCTSTSWAALRWTPTAYLSSATRSPVPAR